jgi:biopolymer transport protein ExbD
MGVMRRTPAIAGAVLVSVLTVGGVAWANGSNETGSGVQKRDCPKTRPHSGWMHHGTAGKVTSVSASAITLVGRDGKSQTVRVDAKTKVFAGRAEAELGDVKSGWLAFVETGSNGVATVIRAVDPAEIREHAGNPSFDRAHVAGGKITAVSASSITLAGRDGKSQTVKIDAKTKVYAGRKQATASALKTGWLAFVQKNDAGVAVSIRASDPAAIRRHFNHHRFTMPHNAAAGKITAVSGSSITLQSRDGKTATVKVNGSTKVVTRDGAVKLSALKAGWLAFAIRGKDGVAVIIRAADPSQFGDHATAAPNSSL